MFNCVSTESSTEPCENVNGEHACRSTLSDRDDLVQVGPGPGNHTLTVRTINVGLTLLAVQDRDVAGVADFVPIAVEQAIHPAEAQRLVVGDVVCFSVQLTSPDGELTPAPPPPRLARMHAHSHCFQSLFTDLCLTSQPQGSSRLSD